MEQRRSRGGFPAWRTASHILAAAVTVAVVAVAGIALTGLPAGAAPAVEDLGPLADPVGVLRDGGESVRLGDDVLWLFGDTLYRGCDPVCASNSAGLGGAKGPTEELGAEFIPLSAAERAAWHAGNDRVAVWPSGGIKTGATTAAVFFARYDVTGALTYEPLGWGIATVSTGDRTATRVLEMGGLPYGHPLRTGRRVYAYGCERRAWLAFACRVARASIASMTEPAAWRYWDGGAWSSDPAAATFVLPGPSGGLSVSWNRHLGSYLATYSLPLTNRVEIRTAPSPAGPWSASTTLFTGLDTPEGTFDYAGIEHPHLVRDGGQTLTVTYYHPRGGFSGELRRVSVTMA